MVDAKGLHAHRNAFDDTVEWGPHGAFVGKRLGEERAPDGPDPERSPTVIDPRLKVGRVKGHGVPQYTLDGSTTAWPTRWISIQRFG